MPRKPTHRSIVRDIREECGWTQTALARRLGTTPITVNRIENGSLKISRRLALRLSWSTGVKYLDIMANAPGRPQTRHGVFSRDQLDEFDQKARNLTAKEFDSLIDNATYRATLILKAALADAPRKFWSLDAAIEASFDDLEKEFGLTASVKRIRHPRIEPAQTKTPQLSKSQSRSSRIEGTESTARRSVESSIEV
jgi:DNA-binding XRE family transcriptional regulator